MTGMKRIAIIGGTGVEDLPKKTTFKRVETPYGASQEIFTERRQDSELFFLARHGLRHETPPHKVNYLANIWALKSLGVERIISTNAVGAINLQLAPGSFVIPDDIIDFTKSRPSTFFNGPHVVHIDVTTPYCPEVRAALLSAAKNFNARGTALYACTEGPRFETPAEIRMMRQAGCDIVGMTNAPEAFLARELVICYGAVCYVSNWAAGLQDRLTASEVIRMGKSIAPKLQEILEEAVTLLPEKRDCPCAISQKESKV